MPSHKMNVDKWERLQLAREYIKDGERKIRAAEMTGLDPFHVYDLTQDLRVTNLGEESVVREAIIIDGYRRGLTSRESAAECGRSRSVVRGVVQRAIINGDLSRAEHSAARRRRVTERELAIVESIDSGRPVVSVAADYGMSETGVRYTWHKVNAVFPGKYKLPGPQSSLDRHLDIYERVQAGETPADIAVELGIWRQSVYRILSKVRAILRD